MPTERMRILAMLGEGKITAEEAEGLLEALETGQRKELGAAGLPGERAAPRFMRVTVSAPGSADGRENKVNVRVPLSLIRAGVRLAAVIPPVAMDHLNKALKEQGIEVDLTQLKPPDIEELVEQLADLTVDVTGERGEQVRVFCE